MGYRKDVAASRSPGDEAGRTHCCVMLSGPEVGGLWLLLSETPGPQSSMGLLGSQPGPGVHPPLGKQSGCPVFIPNLTQVSGQLIHPEDNWMPQGKENKVNKKCAN